MWYIDMIINGFYGLDILINFRTTYYDEEGQEVTDGVLVALKYIKTTLFIDIITVIPFEEIIPIEPKYKDMLRIISILKATRIPKFRNVIYRLEIKDEIKALYSIAVMFIYLICYVHCTTCLFFYLISIDKTWIPLREAAYLKTDLWYADLIS
jgi:hypothetical protein